VTLKTGVYATHSALITGINYILQYISIYILNGNNISQYYCFYCIFTQINEEETSFKNAVVTLKVF